METSKNFPIGSLVYSQREEDYGLILDFYEDRGIYVLLTFRESVVYSEYSWYLSCVSSAAALD